MLNHPEVTQTALSTLRSGALFQWYLIPMLAFVLYIYANEFSKKNYKVIAAGLSFYMVHWFAEITNAMIQHFTGHALWTVPSGSAFLLLVGVGAELSLMFSVAGLVMSKFLPDDPKMKIFGINNRLLFAIANAAFFSVFEIFLVKTPGFVWVYPWWGALPVFITVYIPFFAAGFFCYDWQPRRQKMFIGVLAAVNILALVIFAGILKWI